MDSEEALTYALRMVRLQRRRIDNRIAPTPLARGEQAMQLSECDDAFDTLTALREVIRENTRHPGPTCPCDMCQSRMP